MSIEAPTGAPQGGNTQPTTTPTTDGQPNTPSQSTVQVPPGYVPVAKLDEVRAEEKQKLYREQESMKEQIKELRTKLDAKSSPDERIQSQIEDLNRQLRESMERTQAAEKAAADERTKYAQELASMKLQAYLDRRMGEERGKGTEMLDEMVGGSTEQEIESSIQAAISEYARLKAQILAKHAPTPAPAPAPAAPAVPVGQTVQTGLKPSDFPRAVNAQAPMSVDAGTEAFTASVAAVTTPDAVRNGQWARNRGAVLERLRGVAAPPADGRAFANQPRQAMPTVTHGDVVQPQGTPTSAPINPTQVQVAPQPPVAQPPVAPQPAPVQPPVYVPPTSGTVDLAAVRAAAKSAAGHALANPALANRAGAKANAAAPGGEYGGQPNHNVTFVDGQHPMARG